MYIFNPLLKKDLIKTTSFQSEHPNTYFVSELNDLPSPVNGVIIIPEKHNVFLLGPLDLEGNRLHFEKDSAFVGISSESTYVWSSLTGTNALITAVGSLPMQNRVENVTIFDSFILSQNDVVSLWTANNSGTTDVTIEDLIISIDTTNI